MLTTLLIITSTLYLLELLYLLIGLHKSDKITINDNYEPTVSVIVAARNEEQFIGQCIESLIHLDYPSDKLEIIIVNDGSSDRTPEIIQSHLNNHSSLRMLSTVSRKGNLRGKTNAIAHGIEASLGEIIMFTDADCRVPVSWVRSTVKHFGAQTGIVGGFTLLDTKRPFEGMQALDWIFLFGVSSSTAALNIPLTVIGNNFSIRRITYEMTGGFQEIPFSVTEDYALVQAVLQKSKYKISFRINSETLVRSRACQDWNQLYRQKQRWGVGGLDMVLRGFIITAIGWIAKFFLLLGIWFVGFPVWSPALLVMICGELIFLLKPLKRFNSIKYLKYFPSFFLYFFAYVLILPFIASMSKKVIWKERNLK
jgi:cellulose synthase/poly-beta-1,6-N-acetylglucosamine synthase-like glycosyltransferase